MKIRNNIPQVELRESESFDRVTKWLKENTHMMRRTSTSCIEEYESKYMQLNLYQVTGEVFIVDTSFALTSSRNMNLN